MKQERKGAGLVIGGIISMAPLMAVGLAELHGHEAPSALYVGAVIVSTLAFTTVSVIAIASVGKMVIMGKMPLVQRMFLSVCWVGTQLASIGVIGTLTLSHFTDRTWLDVLTIDFLLAHPLPALLCYGLPAVIDLAVVSGLVAGSIQQRERESRDLQAMRGERDAALNERDQARSRIARLEEKLDDLEQQLGEERDWKIEEGTVLAAVEALMGDGVARTIDEAVGDIGAAGRTASRASVAGALRRLHGSGGLRKSRNPKGSVVYQNLEQEIAA